MERYAVQLVLLASAIALPSPQSSKQYRDYEYSQLANAFFKLHTEETEAHKAKQVCELEGGELMVPRSIQDVVQVHALMKQFPDIGEYVWVGDDGETHESAEDNAIFKFSEETEYPPYYRPETKCLVITRDGQIEDHICSYSRLPFVCKVDLASAPYDAQCDVYAKDYVYITSVGSCYRVSKVAYTWNQAYAACQAEGAHLLVINSQAESQAVMGLLSTRTMLRDSFSPYYYIVGIRANKDNSTRTFRTIFNQTLPEAGFSKWADSEPNNKDGNEYCGSIYESDGKYNDQNCGNAYAFICEKEKHT